MVFISFFFLLTPAAGVGMMLTVEKAGGFLQLRTVLQILFALPFRLALQGLSDVLAF